LNKNNKQFNNTQYSSFHNKSLTSTNKLHNYRSNNTKSKLLTLMDEIDHDIDTHTKFNQTNKNEFDTLRFKFTSKNIKTLKYDFEKIDKILDKPDVNKK